MSTTGQAVGGVVGAAVGFVASGFNPMGAVYGAQLGMMAGGYLDPPKGPTQEGPRLSDLTVQTSTYGQFIPRTYGTIGLAGNVFWLENNQLKEVVRKKKSGGKGGGSGTTVKTYTYFATFAVGLCEGPIAGVRRIWVGPDLVYNSNSDDLETIIASNNASTKFTIYNGSDTQQPDPRMQADIGVASCPAFRGLAYIVVKDLALEKYGNSLSGAQVKVEIVNALDLSGLRKILDVQSGITVPEGAYIYDALTTASVSTVAGEFSSFVGTGGTVTRPMEVLPDTQLPTSPAGFVAQGYLGGKILQIRANNDLYIDGDVLHGGAVVNIGYVGKKITGATVSSDQAHCIIFTIDSSLGTNGDNDGEWRIYNSSFDLISTGAFITESQNTLGMGRSAISGYRASVLENDLGHLTTIYGAGGAELTRFKLSDWSYETLGSAIATGGPFTKPTIYEASGIVHVLAGTGSYRFATSQKITAQAVTLSSIVESEVQRSGIVSLSDIDTTGLIDSVTGFKVTATGSIRNAIEPLRGAWPFDVVQSGYKIKATTRGSASVVTIPVGELLAGTQLVESREMDSQLPQNITVKYLDIARDYDINEQRAQRYNTEAVNSLIIELPVVLSANQSAQVADKLIRIYAMEKSDFAFSLPAPYCYLEPGDVITLVDDSVTYVLRLVSVNQTSDGKVECSARPSSASTYASIAAGEGGQESSVTIPVTGSTVGMIVDCPVINDDIQDAPGFVVGLDGFSNGWSGGVLFRSADNGQTWDDVQAFSGRATAGNASTVLDASEGNLIQVGGSLTVWLVSGTLESVTESQMLNGANIAAYGVDGRWEIIRFQNATMNVDGSYTLTTFWRGDKGTEWATGLHQPLDMFVLMTDPDLAFIGMPTDSIGQPRNYRAVTAGADIDSAANQPFTYAGVNLETLSGVNPVGTRSAGDLTITWQRRTRVGGAWRDYVDASMGESVEAYEVDIMQGATVKRTITATTPSVLYTSAQQIADFGVPQSSVTVRIYQMSSVVGRGYPLEATL